jgi:transcriptional regulator with XRE-family HTH domain
MRYDLAREAMTTHIPVGDRIRFYRESRGFKQYILARRVGVTEDYVSMIERGVKTPSATLLHRIARNLGVSTAVLLDEPIADPDSIGNPAIPAIRQALLQPTAATPGTPDLTDLHARVKTACSMWQAPQRDYRLTGRLLPRLIGEVEVAIRRFQTPAEATRRRDAHRIAADLYGLVRTYTKRSGRVDMAVLAADRQHRAAEAADDPIRIAASWWNLGHALLAEGDSEGAETVSIKAAEAIAPYTNRDAAFDAMHGALNLVALTGSVRNGDRFTAMRRLTDIALPAARRTGDTNVMWTVFGPANVGLHAVMLEADSGEPSQALRLAGEVNLLGLTSAERRFTLHLELARCHEMRHDDRGVLVELLQAERESLDDLRYGNVGRELLRALMKRARPSYAGEVRALAERVGLYR